MRSKILSNLKNADDYVSGEDISRKLGISRAAVWKHIKKLKSDGYEIISVTNKGYKLAAVPDAISKNVIGLSLNTEVIARNIIYTEEQTRTQSDTAPKPTVLFLFPNCKTPERAGWEGAGSRQRVPEFVCRCF